MPLYVVHLKKSRNTRDMVYVSDSWSIELFDNLEAAEERAAEANSGTGFMNSAGNVIYSREEYEEKLLLPPMRVDVRGFLSIYDHIVALGPYVATEVVLLTKVPGESGYSELFR